MERLLTAYQEDLLSLDELRRRMPELRAREESMRAERQVILDQAADRMSFHRLAETLTAVAARGWWAALVLGPGSSAGS